MDRFRQLMQFLREVRAEGDRVQWPAARQTLVTTGAIMVFVAITAVYLGGVDFVISQIVEAMLR